MSTLRALDEIGDVRDQRTPFGAGFRIALLALAAGTAALRLTAITWGQPFVYHADEHLVLHRAFDMVSTGDLHPRWFGYPSFWIYVQAGIVKAVHLLLSLPLESNHLVNGIGPNDVLIAQWPFVLLGRIAVAATAAVGTVLIAMAGAWLFSPPVGLVAGAFLMVAPLHNEVAHRIAVHVPAAALLSGSLYLAVRRRPQWLPAGFLGGLAAGTHYGGGVVAVALAVLALAPQHPAETITRLSRIVIGLLIGFALSTPFAIFDAVAFAEQLRMFWSGADRAGVEPTSWRPLLTSLYRDGLGPMPAVLALLGVAWAIGDGTARLRRGRIARAAALVLGSLVFLGWLAASQRAAPADLVLVLPFLCLLAAEFLERVAILVRPAWLARLTFALLAAVAVVGSLELVLEQNRRLLQTDTRSQALRWIEANLPAGARVAREEHTPQIQGKRYQVIFVSSLARRPFEWYAAEGVEYLIASSRAYAETLAAAQGGSAAAEFYQALFSLPLVAEFTPGPAVNGPVIRIHRLTQLVSADAVG